MCSTDWIVMYTYFGQAKHNPELDGINWKLIYHCSWFIEVPTFFVYCWTIYRTDLGLIFRSVFMIIKQIQHYKLEWINCSQLPYENFTTSMWHILLKKYQKYSYLWCCRIKTHTEHRVGEFLKFMEVAAATDIIHIGLKWMRWTAWTKAGIHFNHKVMYWCQT